MPLTRRFFTGVVDTARPELEIRVILVCNYECDRQESMLRFSALLAAELPAMGVAVETMRPAAYFATWPLSSRARKWLAYLDKFVIFPFVLLRRLRKTRKASHSLVGVVVHICDHGNALYRFFIRQACVVTCHDLLAVRGALGEDTDCPASRLGWFFQRLILRGLRQADFVVCDSSATRGDLIRLGGCEAESKSKVILLCQNRQFRRLDLMQTVPLLSEIPKLDSTQPFILVVGSNLLRKNRRGALRIFAAALESWSGQLVIAGEALDAPELALASSLNIADRIVQAHTPSNETLEALYSLAFVLLYPSKCEGFGWPIIEAQACGCPVICSDRTSLPEVAGEGAIICDLDDESAFCRGILTLKEDAVRNQLIERGYQNLPRFQRHRMLTEYRDVYRTLATGSLAK